MQSIKPIYLIALVLVIGFVAYIKISNPYREYSTTEYWEEATLASVAEIPDDALKAGNKNGPVIMWAAVGTGNIQLIKVLLDRGADINEADELFGATPLSGASGFSKYPEIIEQLIKLGADINKKVNNQETALMIAAQYNENPGIATMLIKYGADINDINKQEKTAFDLAKLNNNTVVMSEIESFKNTLN